MPDEQVFDPRSALLAHEALRARVERDRAPLASAAFPLQLFGVITLVSAVVAALASDMTYGIYWMIMGPLGGVLIGVHYGRASHRVSIRIGSYWPAVFASVALIIVASTLGGATSAPAAPFAAVAAGYLVFGLLWKSQATLVASSLIALLAAAEALLEPANPNVWLGITVGLVQLACAAAERQSWKDGDGS